MIGPDWEAWLSPASGGPGFIFGVALAGGLIGLTYVLAEGPAKRLRCLFTGHDWVHEFEELSPTVRRLVGYQCRKCPKRMGATP